MESPTRRLSEHPVHLAPDGQIVQLPAFTGTPEWYADYERRHGSDGPGGRLVSWHRFESSWDSWEMHPHGDELVVCVAGRIELVQERDGVVDRIPLDAGEAAVNAPGVWHTADLVPGTEATCVFITSGVGTEHRGR